MTESNRFSIETEKGNRVFHYDINCDSRCIGNNNRDFKKMRSKLKKLTKKYGWTDFKLEIAESKDDFKENYVLENKYETSNSSNPNQHSSKSTNKQERPILQYDKNGRFLTEWPSAYSAAISLKISPSNILACLYGKTTSSAGFVWRYKEGSVINEKLPSSSLEGIRPYRKAVLQFDKSSKLISEYSSCAEAGRTVGVSACSIGKCCKGVISHNSAGGYIWKYKEDVPAICAGTDSKKTLKQVGIGTGQKTILQYDLEGNFIAEWKTMSEAARSIGKSVSLISLCLKGKKKTCGGFLWKYGDGERIKNRLSNKELNVMTLSARNKKPVLQYDKHGYLVSEYASPTDAAKETGIAVGSITRCCNGELKSSGGFHWKYKEDAVVERRLSEDALKNLKSIAGIARTIIQYDKQGNFIAEYSSIREAARKTGVNQGNICSCCRGSYGYVSAGGYVWKYNPCT